MKESLEAEQGGEGQFEVRYTMSIVSIKELIKVGASERTCL